MTLKNYTFLQLCQMLIVPAFFATLKMLVISGIMSTIFGFIFGVILVITEKGGLCENVVVNRILDFDYSIYKINRGNVHRRDSGSCTAYCSMLSIYGTYFPEQF